jgi:alpha-methylacyl-CoA racemase
MRPLEGLFVLDFSTLLPGPLATLLLAEAGAEVVKIERPGNGEEMRSRTPKWGTDSANFALLNRGKRSVALDLKNPAERARLQPLAERADVIVEQFRPGVMARLGLDYDAVAKVNPTVIYCSISGYGQSGSKRDVAAHDLNYISDVGLLGLSMGDLSRPVLPPTLIADIAGGAYPAVLNILLGLEERRRSGRGRHLDVAMTDNLFPLMFWAIGHGFAVGTWPRNGTGYVTGGSPRYGLYPTKDGRVVAAAPLEQKFWETFCDLIGLELQLRDDGKSPAATKARVAERSLRPRRQMSGALASLATIVAARSLQASLMRLWTRTMLLAACSITCLPIPKVPPCRRSRCHSIRAFGQRPQRLSLRPHTVPIMRSTWHRS